MSVLRTGIVFLHGRVATTVVADSDDEIRKWLAGQTPGPSPPFEFQFLDAVPTGKTARKRAMLQPILDDNYLKRLQARQRLAIEYAAFAALPKSEEARCLDHNGMLSNEKVVRWYRKNYPQRACEIETGLAERSMKAKVRYHRDFAEKTPR